MTKRNSKSALYKFTRKKLPIRTFLIASNELQQILVHNCFYISGKAKTYTDITPIWRVHWISPSYLVIQVLRCSFRQCIQGRTGSKLQIGLRNHLMMRTMEMSRCAVTKGTVVLKAQSGKKAYVDVIITKDFPYGLQIWMYVSYLLPCCPKIS